MTARRQQPRRIVESRGRTGFEFQGFAVFGKGLIVVSEGGQRLVNVKQLAATIVSPSNAGPAIDLVARWHKTKEVPPPLVTLSPTSYPREDELARRAASFATPSRS